MVIENPATIYFQKELARQRHSARQAVRDFVQGAAIGDLGLMAGCLAALDYGDVDGGGWARAMRAVSKLASVPDSTRAAFLQVFISHGDHIRQECHDLALAKGLRALLPKYGGPAVRLFRGEGFLNRSRRTYGASWSAEVEVARGFAECGFYRVSRGGSVLLETLAPPDAIICAPALLDDRYGETEYIVDRRMLGVVKVSQRFRQLSQAEFAALPRREGA